MENDNKKETGAKSSLMKFQEDGAELICKRLFSDTKGKKRFLLADEVGLGKTVTTAKVIEKRALELKKHDIKMTVGYICSNLALASVNAKKLKKNIGNGITVNVSKRDRLSMLFLDGYRLYGESKEKTQRTILPGLTARCKNNQIYEYIYYLTPYDEKHYIFEKEKENGVVCPKWYKACTDRIMTFNHPLGEIKRYSEDKKELIQLLLGETIRVWDDAKAQIRTNIFPVWFNECRSQDNEFTWEALYHYCTDTSANDAVIDRLKKEIADGIKDRLKKEIADGIKDKTDKKQPRFKESQYRRFVENYIYKYKESLDKIYDINMRYISDVDIIAVTPETSLSGSPERPSNGSMEERAYCCLLLPVKDDNDNVRLFYEIIHGIIQDQKNTIKTFKDYLDTYSGREPNWLRLYHGRGTSNKLLEQAFYNLCLLIRKKTDEDFRNEYLKINNRRYKIASDGNISAVNYDDIKYTSACLKQLGLKKVRIDLFISDEIQNYSHIINTVTNNESGSLPQQTGAEGSDAEKEAEEIVIECLGKDRPVLMLSATPFRYLNDNGRDAQTRSSGKVAPSVFDDLTMIAGFLMQDADNKKDWTDRWKSCEKEKNDAVIGSDHEKYLRAVRAQEEMMRELNILRTERYMAGSDQSFSTEHRCVPVDEVLLNELLRVPKAALSIYISPEEIPGQGSEDFFYFRDEDENYYYSEDRKNFYRITNDFEKNGCRPGELFSGAEDDCIGYLITEENAASQESCPEFDNYINSQPKVGLGFIKSTPALFSFSEGYQKLNAVKEADIIKNATLDGAWIRDREKLIADGKTEDGEGHIYNARMKELFRVLFDVENQHRLLFVPPAASERELGGVFKNAYGVSKRLFFSEWEMTPKSLAFFLNNEAERRAYNDWMKKYNDTFREKGPLKIIITDDDSAFLTWDNEKGAFRFEIPAGKTAEEFLFDYDKSKKAVGERALSEAEKYGSPYIYASGRKGINASEFCLLYFRYMSAQHSLLVLFAYLYSGKESLYDLIMQYGADGCIHDVFDEHIFLLSSNGADDLSSYGNGFLDLFSKNYSVSFKENNNTISQPCNYALIWNTRSKSTNDKDEAVTLEGIITRFNSPFLPFNFISTSVGQEGFDFQSYCRRIVHWSLTDNPVEFEQREGRINRFRCYANRLQASCLFKRRKKRISTDWDEIYDCFSDKNEKIFDSEDEIGLVPNFVFPLPEADAAALKKYGLVRETYYYPQSYEDQQLDEVLKRVGYYRALLGSHNDETFEKRFREFIKPLSKAEIRKYFIDISSVETMKAETEKLHSAPQPEKPPAQEVPPAHQPEKSPAQGKNAAPQPAKDSGAVKDQKVISFAEWYGNDIRTNVINGKKLIVGQPSNGKTLLLREAAERNGLAGIEAVTITETAMPIVAECLAGSIDWDSLRNICLEPISHNMAVCIMLDIIRRKYRDMENILTYSTAEEIFRTVNMLRMNGLKECKKISGFNIGEILTEYESVLQTKGLYDKARLLQEAIHYLEELHGSEKRCAEELHGYAFLDDHTPDILETKLINLLTNNNVRTVSEGGTTLKDVRLFKTYGMMDEVLTIAKEIQSENLVSGDTAIYYTDQAYVDMIKCVFGEMNIPVFFKDGSSAEKDSTIRLWLSILEWWKNDCRMEYFENILFNPVVQIPGGVNTDKDDLQESSINKDRKSAILKYISRNIGYLYGRHNMMVLAKRFSDKGTEDAQTKKSPEDMALEFIHDLTEIFRAGSINRQCQMYKPSDFFCTGLMSFTEKYHIPDKDYSGLKRSIEIPIRYISCGFDFDGLYSLLSGQLKSLRISEQYAPDAVTAQRLTGQKTISPAMNTFIIGLSSSLVLKKADESPLISDDEISRLIPDDRAKKYLGAQKNVVISDAVKYLVSCIQNGGTLTVSYPCYDQAELKMCSSSDIFESLYTTYGNQADIPEYNSLSFLDSAEAFSKRDSSALFALEKLGKEDTAGKIINDAFLRVMEEFGIKNNTKTESKSAGADQMLKLRLSASSFDTLLNCPRKYYIENIFGIREEPEQKAGSGWLKPNQKGTIFHNVMEEYIGSFCGEEEKLSERDPKEKFRFDKERFEKIFESVISKYDVIPYDLPADKEQEITEIKDTAKKYLDELAAVQNDGYAPCAVEYKFKTGQKTEDLSDSEDGNVFTDQIGGFELEYTIGFLDRVDKKTGSDGKPHFRIVDYKTGSLDNFIEDHNMILVQHYVYQKALQETLGNSGIVDEFVFVFPFDRSRSVWEYCGGKFNENTGEDAVTKIIVRKPDDLNGKITSILVKYKGELTSGNCPAHDVSYRVLHTKAKSAKYDKRAAVKNCRFIDICGGCADRS